MRSTPHPLAVACLIGLVGVADACLGDDTPDRLVRADRAPVDGRLIGDIRDGFRFEPADGSATVAVDGPAEVRFGGSGPGPTAGIPTIQVVLGRDQRVSGGLAAIDDATIRLDDGPGGGRVAIDRRGALAVRQRPGEVVVLADGFDSIDPDRWVQVGDPKVDAEPRLSGSASLRLQADGTALTRTLDAPVLHGRLEVAFHDEATVVPGAQWFIDLLFRGGDGPESIRAVLGWSEESLAVSTRSGGSRPALAIQRLARRPGWHRLEVRFGRDVAELAVDGNALAVGKGATGPLVEIRIGTSLAGDRPTPGLAAHLDDLRLVQVAANATSVELDPGQDELLLVEGDQVFGRLHRGDARSLIFDVLGVETTFGWNQVASVGLRRDPKPSREVDGLLGRVEWRTAPGTDPRDLDAVEGAVVALDAASCRIETPYAGRLTIPRDRLRRAVLDGRGRRLVVDPTAHHLGDSVSKAPELLDPPQPEGGVLDRTFAIARPPGPDDAASLVLDVVQVVGEAEGLPYSHLVRNNEIRTKVSINGREFDYINRYVRTRNDTPERLRIPVPPGAIRPGENRLTLTQTGTTADPNYFDDLGILGIALDVGPAAGKP